MKKKFSKEALYNEWEKYKKWYNKQKEKGMALSDRSRIIAGSFSEYMFYRDQASEGMTSSNDILQEMKRRSYKVSVRQLEHLSEEITNWLVKEATYEEKVEFLERFGADIPLDKEGRVDTSRIVEETLHGNIEPLEMVTGKHHGWYGTLASMMEYIQTIGGRVTWNS